MKTLYRSLTAVLFALCLGMHALADVLPEPLVDPEPPKTGSVLPLVLIIAVIAAALAVLILVLRRRRR